MASFVKLPAGSWRAIVRRKSRYISETFRRKDDARAWALDAERQIDRGEAPKASRTARLRTFGDLIDLHIEDMKEVGRARAARKTPPSPCSSASWADATWPSSTATGSYGLAARGPNRARVQ